MTILGNKKQTNIATYKGLNITVEQAQLGAPHSEIQVELD